MQLMQVALIQYLYRLWLFETKQTFPLRIHPIPSPSFVIVNGEFETNRSNSIAGRMFRYLMLRFSPILIFSLNVLVRSTFSYALFEFLR